MQIVERYNKILQESEDYYTRLLNKALSDSFQRLVRRTNIQIKARQKDKVVRNTAVLENLKELVPDIAPDKQDRFYDIFQKMINSARRKGLVVADDITGRLVVGPRVNVEVPLEATDKAIREARGYLRKHGITFAETSAKTIAQGIAEGRPTDSMISDLVRRLGVVRSRGEVIVRTENQRAYNKAADDYYKANNIDLVAYYATSDDRTCPYCTPRAGKIYKRGEISVPIHPRCRCYLAPYLGTEKQIAAIAKHSEEVMKEYRSTVGQPAEVNLNRAAVFEKNAPIPITPSA
jgi:SPP1 gp7 family putative phage head morphogenesis protein